jgi:chaperone required for assembly of F1-ATPase
MTQIILTNICIAASVSETGMSATTNQQYDEYIQQINQWYQEYDSPISLTIIQLTSIYVCAAF